MPQKNESDGWIRLYRSLFVHEFADETWDRITAWMYLVSLATYKSRDVTYRRRIYHIKRGQAAIVMSDLATKAKWPKEKVRRFFRSLVRKEMITISGSFACCILTVSNYEKYQVGTLLESAVVLDAAKTTALDAALDAATDSPSLTIGGALDTAKDTALDASKDTQNNNVLKKERIKRVVVGNKIDDDPVVMLYRKICVPKGLPNVLALTPFRIRAIKRIIDGYGLERLEALFRKAVTSDFLLGKSPSKTHSGWRADFDFLVKADTLVYINEGARYFDEPLNTPPPFEPIPEWTPEQDAKHKERGRKWLDDDKVEEDAR